MTTITFRISLLLILFFQFNSAFSQDFITRWELPAGSGYISFFLESGPGGVDYIWETIPAGSTGTGNFPEGNGQVELVNLPVGATIRLSLAPQNLKHFYNVIQYEGLVDVEAWGTAIWTSMENAFWGCPNLQVSATDVPDLSSVNSLAHMFMYAYSLNGPSNIDSWDISNVTDLTGMFQAAMIFNQALNSWNTSNILSMQNTFAQAHNFNQPLDNWNTSSVTNMGGMFSLTPFNQPIGNWNTGNVQSFFGMFSQSMFFNQDISNWNTSNLSDATAMFWGATAFNQPLGNWNMQNASNLSSMFTNAPNFNQDISSWNTSNVIYMYDMFRNADSFNQDISSWDVSMVEQSNYMFADAENFNQNLGSWTFDNAFQITGMFNNSGMNCDNYSATLIGWAQNPNISSFMMFEANGLEYSPVAAGYRNQLINDKGWTITGDVQGSTNCTLSLTEDQISSVNYYPNPVEDHINIESEIIVKKIIISDLLGNSLMQKEVSEKAANISLIDFTSGYYLMKIIKADSSEEVVRILKL